MSKGTVYTWAKVYVNGQDYGVHEVKVSAAIANDLPGRLNFGAGITQRTGEIHWSNAVGKDGLLVSPYRRLGAQGFRLPSHNDRIQVRMGIQQEDPRLVGFEEGELVFTGKVDYSEVSHGGYPTTHIIDDIDRLNRVVRFPAFRHHLPPKPDGRGRYRHIGFTPDSLLTFLASACGYHVTPPPPAGAVYLSAPLQGTMYPTPNRGWGELAMAERNRGNTHDLPRFEGTPNGLGVVEGIGDWAVTNSAPPARIVFSIWVGEKHSALAWIYARLTNNVGLGFTVKENRHIYVRQGNLIYPSGVYAKNEYVSIAMTPDGRAQVKTASAEATITVPAWETAPVDAISLDADSGSHLSGLNVYGTAGDVTDHPITRFTPTAFIKCGYPYPLHLARSIRDEKAIDVIKEICEATCCVSYLDGEGKLVIEYGRSAYGRATVGTLDVSKSIRGYKVKDDSQLAARSVVVKYKTPEGAFTNRQAGVYVDLWEAPVKAIDAGAEEIFFLGPADDEEWLEVDESFTYANADDSARAEFTRKNGSFSGFAVTSGTAGAKNEWWGGGVARLERIVPWKYKLTLSPHDASSTKVPEVNTVHQSMWGTGMPKLRGGANLKFVDADPYVVSWGPDNAADLTHDAGGWVTNTRAQDIAEFAAKYSKAPLPVLYGVECFFDPSIKVNQRWTIDLTETVGVKVLCFILGVEHDPASDTTSVDVRVLEDLSPWVWASLPENYRSFQAVKNDFSTFQAMKAGK